MPKIITQADVNRLQRQRMKSETSNEIRTSVSRSDLRASYYQMQEWKRLRLAYRMQHPLDELSLLSDRVEAAEDVHHVLSPFEYGKTSQQIIILLLDPDNLISVTKLHHGIIHADIKQLTQIEKELMRQKKESVRSKYHYIF